MWMQIKGSNAEIQDPFPFGTCFYFSAVAANQNFHLLSFCSVQVNLNSGAQSTVISAKKYPNEDACMYTPNSSQRCPHSRERTEPARKRIHYSLYKKINFQLIWNIKIEYKLKMGFCFLHNMYFDKDDKSNVICCLFFLLPIPRSSQQTHSAFESPLTENKIW